ncbi:MAG: hypothetical protein ACLPN1_03055 [Dissulfurispiraceae bacterium]
MAIYLSSKRITIIFICTLLVMLSCSNAELTGWKILQEDTYGNNLSYNAESVKHTEDHVTVSVRSNSTKYLYEIDCKNGKARIVQEDGKSSSNPQWFDIVGQSGDELVYKAVCL